MTTSIRTVVIAILIALISFFAGDFAGETGALGLFGGHSAVAPPDNAVIPSKSVKKEVPKKGSYEEGYAAGLDFARVRLSEVGLLPSEDRAVNNLRSATVISVSGNKVVVEYDSAELDILSEGMIQKTVTVPADVIIEYREPRPEEEVQKEFEEFEKKQQELRAKIEIGEEIPEEDKIDPPVPYKIVELKPSDLNTGDILRVRSDEDVRSSDSFTAVEVRVDRKAELVQ